MTISLYSIYMYLWVLLVVSEFIAYKLCLESVGGAGDQPQTLAPLMHTQNSMSA